MKTKVIIPPTEEPISLEDVKQYLRISGNDDDILVASLIRQAREWCEDFQGRKFVTQTLEGVLDKFPSVVEFSDCSPVQSILSIKYIDSANIEHIINPENYLLDNDSFVNRVVPAYGKAWPSTTLQPINGVRIRFIAGYGDAAVVPESVKWAMVIHMRLLNDDYKPEERSKLEQARSSLLGMRRVIRV